MRDSSDLLAQAPIFAALGDRNRLSIVARLGAEGPHSTSELAEPLAISRQAVSKHLAALETAGLLVSEKTGRERRWQLETRTLKDAQRYLQQISTRWDEAIERLRHMVEDESAT